MRAMAENKLKHSGQYKNPTYPLAPGSTMNKPIEFDWKKVANKSQGGIPEAGTKTHWGTKGDYGASPFILQHFSGDPKPFKKGERKDYPKETDIQRKARLIFMAKKLLDKAKEATAPIANPIPEAPEAPKDADPIPHFGNVSLGEPPVGIEVIPKAEPPKKKKKVFIDAETGEILKDERNEPPTPKNEIVSTAPPEPPAVVEPVVEAKPKRVLKVKKPKVAESPTPPNPIPRVVWTEEELKTNPLTRNDYEVDDTRYDEKQYAEKDEREMSLFLYALNNPKAKLADAIKHLKDNDIGKGFSPSTISPLYKEARKDADKILEAEEKQIKTLSNPAFASLKEKFSSLFQKKANRPLETIKNAFKRIDAVKYYEMYLKHKEEYGEGNKYLIDADEQLRHRGGGEWAMFHKSRPIADGKKWETGIDPTKEKFIDGSYSHQYGKGTHWQTWKKALDVKDAKGEPVKVGDDLIIAYMWEDDKTFTRKVWVVDDKNMSLFIPSTSFPKGEETPGQRIHNTNEGNSGRFPRYVKGISRVFYPRELWEYNKSVDIGRQINHWLTHKKDETDPDMYRKFNIGTARHLNLEAISLEKKEYDYTTTVNGVDYICPRNPVGGSFYDLQPSETPEERGRMEKPVEPQPMPKKGEYTEANAGEALGKFDDEDETNYFDSLSPSGKKLALWHLNNSIAYSMNSPEIPEGRAKASEIRKEIEILFKRRVEENKEYRKKKLEYDYSIAKSKKKTGSGNTEALEKLLKSAGNLGDFLLNKTPLKYVKDAFNASVERHKDDRKNGIPLRRLGGAYKLNVVSEADAKNPEEIKVLPIKNKVRYAKAKEALLEALSNYTVPPVASRANLLGTESGMMAGKKSGDGIVARGVAFGFGNNRRGFDYYVKNKQNPEVYKALVDFGEAIVPKGWDFQTIQLNHNAKAKKHRDKNNVGKSVIIGIGDYNGGELRVWDKEDDKHKDYNIKDRPTMFNGALLSHETQPFNNPTDYEPGKGRYTIVYFRHKYKPMKGNVGVGSGLYTMEGKGMAQPSASAIEDLFV